MVGLPRKWNGTKIRAPSLALTKGFFMKFSSALSLAVVFAVIGSTGSIGYAGCREAYLQEFRTIESNADFNLNTTTLATVVFGVAGTTLGSGPVVITSGAGAATSAGITTVAKIRKESLMKVIRLLDQSEVGIGIELAEFAKDIDAITGDVATTILNLNSRNILCMSSTGLLSRDEIGELVKNSLRKK